jgi:Uma2 family endonuclease
MNAFARIDRAAFLRIAERERGPRMEWVRGRIVQQMTGGSRDHGQVGRRIMRQLEDQLDASLWTTLYDRGVDTPETIRYPDVVVEPADEPGKSRTTFRPALVVEVLSPSTTSTDLDVKPAEYLALATLDAYIIASQDEPALLIYERGANGQFPSEPREVTGAADEVRVTCRGFNVTLALTSIYRGVGQ